MSRRNSLIALASIVVIASFVVAAVWTRETWQDWFSSNKAQAPPAGHAHAAEDVLELTPQAQTTLDLRVRPIQVGSYWRTIEVPAIVVKRPGRSDHTVTTPLAGVVEHIAAVPGQAVQPGQPLFAIRLISEHLQNHQTELYKTTRELQINKELKEFFDRSPGSIPQARLLEIRFQDQRLSATVEALRFELLVRGLTSDQIEEIKKGNFVTHITIRVPVETKPKLLAWPGVAGKETSVSHTHADTHESTSPTGEPLLEIEELKVMPGDQVQVGQTLCILARHATLYLEARVFQHEIPLLRRAEKNGWLMRAEFVEIPASWPFGVDPQMARNTNRVASVLSLLQRVAQPWNSLVQVYIAETVIEDWSPFVENITIEHLDNEIHEASQTVPVHLRLYNEYRDRKEGDKTFRVWRFKPSQRAYIQAPVELLENKIIVPVEAVVREGAEAYVFRQNGNAFERMPVTVVYSDRNNVVLANDGSITPGHHFAHHGTAQLQRALKTQLSGGGGGHHGHMH